MIRSAILFLFLASPLLGQDIPAPTDPERPQLTVGKDVSGVGTRKDPFVFTTSTKPVIRLTGSGVESAVWDTSDGPADFEVIGQVGIFSLAEPGTYVVYVRTDKAHAKAWFQVKSGTDPPTPAPVEDGITKRVKAALNGNPVDAKKYSEVCRQMSEAVSAGLFPTQSAFEKGTIGALAAAKWQQGKYPDLSQLGKELFNRGDKDWVLTDADKAAFAKSLDVLSKAAAEVK